MVEHVRVLGVVGIVRAIFALVLWGILVTGAGKLQASHYGHDVAPRTIELDRTAFLVVGWASLALGLLRLVQSLAALLGYRFARRFGLVLAVFDLLNLILFPVSTALGLYGLVVYRHPETVERFRRRK